MCSPWVFRALQVYSPSSAASTVAKVSTPPRITALGLILFAGPPGTNHIYAHSSSQNPKVEAQTGFKDKDGSRSRVLPLHSRAGVGLPVAVQRNSARWPCWTFSTGGVMEATGWAPSPAVEPNTTVKHSA